ncbi:RNA polymerase 1 [Alteromonas phage vB_AemP_PT15-A5]|nr:RNA polymerase 1 [Alteromonas phage vB_AemP_PT15-A5]
MNLNVLRQMTIEDTYAKREINKRIWQDLASDDELKPILKELRRIINDYKYNYSKWWRSKQERIVTLTDFNNTEDIMTYIAVGVLKATDGTPIPIQGAVEYVARRLEGFSDHMDAVRTASELIADGADSDLYDVIAAKDSETGSLMLRARWGLEDETEQYIADTMYLPPLICEPKEILNNTSSAYMNPAAESVILKSFNHHEHPTAVDALNIANETPLELDEFMLDNFEETPNKELDTNQKVLNFQLLKNSSLKVYRMIRELGNKFWFSWRFDKRGRMYIQGYHVNLQSTQFKKSIISLAEKETINVSRTKRNTLH